MEAKKIDDPLFKQRYGFSRHGETLHVEMWTDPGGGVRAEHIHPALEERYEVLEGEITINLEGETRRLGAGQRAVVPPGVRHSFENTGDRPAHLVAEAEAGAGAPRVDRGWRAPCADRTLFGHRPAADCSRAGRSGGAGGALQGNGRAHVAAAVRAAHPLPAAGKVRAELMPSRAASVLKRIRAFEAG